MTILAQQEKLEALAERGATTVELMLAEQDCQSANDRSYQERKREALALIVSCLRDTGRYGREANQLLAEVISDGYTAEEHTQAEHDADAIRLPWAQFRQHGEAVERLAGIWRAQLENQPPNANTLPRLEGEKMSLDADWKAPQWLVPGILARGKVHMLSGSWGSAKTLLREAMMASSLLGTPFLGRAVPRLKWLILDGENSLEDVEARWKALGLTDALVAEHVLFTGKKAHVKLGTPEGDRRFSDAAERFNPDVIWIDSVMRCCAATISNEDATRLVDEIFAPLAEDHDAAVAFSHHHRKSAGNASTTSDASLGGAQFTGQPDFTMTMAKTSSLTVTKQPDGTELTETRFAFRPCKSGRGAYLTRDEKEPVVVKGIRRADDEVLLSLTVDHLKAEPTLDERVLSVLADGPLGNTPLAEKLEVHRTGDALKSALGRLTEAHLIVKNDDKLYELTR